MAETQLSRDAYARLEAELQELSTEGRVKIARDIEAARALGDLSENGDYHAAKDSQGKMETRIRLIEHTLKNATILEAVDDGRVSAGSVVGLRYEGDEDIEHFLIGSIEEKREGLAVISPGSPLGQALLGQTPGSKVEYEAPSGFLKVEIIEVGT